MPIFTDHPFTPAPDTPLYQQIYAHLQSAILAGKLPGGLKLPSTRALAAELLVSRNTVLTAYDQLTAEGYLESVAGSGTFVADVLPDHLLTTPAHHTPPSNARQSEPTQPLLSARAKAQLTASQIYPRLPPTADGRPRPFRLGMSALDAFPYEQWSRLITRQARRMSIRTITYQEPSGYRPLREAIAAHVNLSRRVQCTAEQIVMVAGTQGGLDLAARLLINEGDPVWLEDPGYIGARGALLGAGAALVPVPIDHEGLMVAIGRERAPTARLAYVTPSHQFPLGVTMSLARRLALLEWAKAANAYIIEDDYDSEYRFAGRPLATLQSLDRDDRVIYVGTFSKILAPALRIGYLILPPLLVEPCLAMRRLIDFHLPILEQAALADFIAEGHFTRHLRRMRTLFAERRTALLEALAALPLDIHAFPVGSHCVGWLPAGMDGLRLAHQAAANDLNLWLVSQYCIEPLAREGLVIGYGDHDSAEMQQAVAKLAKVMHTVWPRG